MPPEEQDKLDIFDGFYRPHAEIIDALLELDYLHISNMDVAIAALLDPLLDNAAACRDGKISKFVARSRHRELSTQVGSEYGFLPMPTFSDIYNHEWDGFTDYLDFHDWSMFIDNEDIYNCIWGVFEDCASHSDRTQIDVMTVVRHLQETHGDLTGTYLGVVYEPYHGEILVFSSPVFTKGEALPLLNRSANPLVEGETPCFCLTDEVEKEMEGILEYHENQHAEWQRTREKALGAPP